MRFESPWVFLALILVLVLLWAHLRIKGSGSLRFSSVKHAQKVRSSLRQKLISLPLVLRILCLLLLLVAAARPQQGKEQVRDLSKGIAIEMVVDRSGSMAAEMGYGGERLTRLEVVKRLFEEFVRGNNRQLDGRHNDLVGMITFARYADTVCPLTLAHGALTQFLQGIKLVTRRDEDGTAIGDALALAAARLKTAEESISAQGKNIEGDYQIKSKIIILLTDGQSNAGERTPLEAAKLAKEWGIKIYAIGVGGGEGLRRQHGILGSFLMRMGEGVDERTLASLAEATGGIYRLAEDADSLRAVYEEINQLERSEVESLRYLDYREMFLPLVLLALALLAAEVLLSCTAFRRIP